jgi:DNA repair ATPase RecN
MQSKKIVSTTDKVPLLYSKDFYEWPDSWMGFDEDLITGEIILKGFVPFIKNLAKEGLSKNTIQDHMENLWLLGSEIIRGVHFDEDQRQLLSKELLLAHLDEFGGPCVHQWDPNDKTDRNNISSYNATCKKLYSFTKLTN